MVHIETERLIVRNFLPGDWHDFQEVIRRYQASESAKYEDSWPTGDEDIRGIVSWFSSGDSYLAVCIKDGGEIIGLVAVERREDCKGRVHNLGYIFDPRRQGSGYATEACRAAMAWVFDQLRADAILTGTKLENEPSVRLLNRLGFKPLGAGEFTLTSEDWRMGQRADGDRNRQD